jgi:hypothetical protein
MERHFNKTHVDLSHQSINHSQVPLLASAMATAKSTHSLNLFSNYLGCYGALLVSNALQSNSHLFKLDLSYNGIGDNGAKAISKILGISHLEELDLDENRIEAEVFYDSE